MILNVGLGLKNIHYGMRLQSATRLEHSRMVKVVNKKVKVVNLYSA